MMTPTKKGSVAASRRLPKKVSITFFLLFLLSGYFPESAFAQQAKKLRLQAYEVPESRIVPPQAQFYAVKSHPSNSSKLFSVTATGLQLSENGGLSWRPIAINGNYDETFAVAIYPANPEVLLVCRRDGLWKSLDGGMLWSLLASPSSVPLAVVFSMSRPDVVYLGTARHGVYKSIDGGSRWTQADTGLPEARAGGRREEIRTLIVDPSNFNVVYAAFPRLGIFRTIDGGTSWEEFNKGIPIAAPISLPQLAFDPDDPRRLFLAMSERIHSHLIRSKVYVLKDDFWIPLGARLPANVVVRGMLVDGPRNVIQLWGSDGVWEIPLSGGKK